MYVCTQGDLTKIRDVYERAIAQVPPVREKRYVCFNCMYVFMYVCMYVGCMLLLPPPPFHLRTMIDDPSPSVLFCMYVHTHRFWRRYIYLWINYALFEELQASDVERTREVYK